MHPVVDPDLWVEMSSSNKRRKFIENHGSSSSEVHGSSHARAPLKEDIAEAVNEAMSSFVQMQLIPILEPILRIVGSLQASLQVVEKAHEDK